MLAPMMLDGPINGDEFEACPAKVLVLTLCPGDIVIMDNLASHKRPAVQDRFEAAGVMLGFLPPYRPDFQSDRKGCRSPQGLL
jgi:transposase